MMVSQNVLGNVLMRKRVEDSFRPREKMNARTTVLLSLLAFASFWTLLAAVASFQPHSVVPVSSSGGQRAVHANPLFGYAVPLSATGWGAVGLVALQGQLAGGLRRSRIKGLFGRRGFGPDVYDLMFGMRGSGSRLSLLQNMVESPRHRLELSELTGIDWKEVDRQISVMEKYGFVKVYAQSGNMKFYQVTENGKLLLKLIGELNSSKAA
jgi:predicted transcriptional regulator